MTSQQAPSPLIVRIATHIPVVERILIATLVIGIILIIMQIDSGVLRFSFIGLSVTFFLLAFRPIDIPAQDNELLEFPAILGFAIVPKVLWISSAISALGIAFYLSDLDHDGYKSMLMIGGTTICACLVIVGFLLIRGVMPLRFIAPILMRAVLLCLVDFYLLMNA